MREYDIGDFGTGTNETMGQMCMGLEMGLGL